jgi:hypothetical protein
MSRYEHDDLESIERRLARIERMLRHLLGEEIEEKLEREAVRTLNLVAEEPVPINKPKPPTQGIGVPSTDAGSVMKPGAGVVETDDMKTVKRLLSEPHVRAYLLKEAKVDMPEQVQHQRILAERIVLGMCQARSYSELTSGDPALRLKHLANRLAVFHANWEV